MPTPAYELGLDPRATVKYYPYRTARVFRSRIKLDRNSDTMQKMEELFAESVNRSIDNHVVYAVINGDAPPLYFWFTDSNVWIGTEIIEESW